MTTPHVIWGVIASLSAIAMLVRLVCAAGRLSKTENRTISVGPVIDEFFIPGDSFREEKPYDDFGDVCENDD